MTTAAQALDRAAAAPRQPIRLASADFAAHKYTYYRWMLAETPIVEARIAFMRFHLVSRYDDCVALLKDPRFVRNRSTATGGGRKTPFPLPPAMARLSRSMIVEDDPEHRRLRGLVSKAFTPRAVGRLGDRVEAVTVRLLDAAAHAGEFDLVQAFAVPIPETVIGEMIGIDEADRPRFRESLRVLSSGLTGWSVLRTLFWDLPKATRFLRDLIDRRRADPRDDILSGLIAAEHEGDRLDEDELVSMIFLLVIAGYETTAHLITNGVLALLDHPDQRERLQAEPALMETAVEEIVRHRGPIHGTKPMFATGPVTLHGVELPRGAPVLPVLGAANHDPAVFDRPEDFDVGRNPNPHVGFGFGNHFCLGAQLARMEARIALGALLERCPDLRLAVDRETIRPQEIPMWHRHAALPVRLG